LIKNVVAGFIPAYTAGNTVFYNRMCQVAIKMISTIVLAGINPATTRAAI
jgi:hypothetical protein